MKAFVDQNGDFVILSSWRDLQNKTAKHHASYVNALWSRVQGTMGLR